MINFIEIENEFSDLSKSLSLSFSPRFKIAIISDFLKKISGNYGLFETYSLELLPIFCSSILETGFKSTNLDFISNTIEVLDYYLIELKDHSIIEIIQKSLDHLKREEAELSKKLNYKSLNRSINIFIDTKETKRLISKKVKGKKSHVLVPFVENEPFIANNKNNFGILSNLFIETNFNDTVTNSDIIDFPNIIDNNLENERHFLNLIEFAKNIFLETTGLNIDKNLVIKCRLDNSRIISGDSIDAGFVITLFSSLFNLFQLRTVFVPRENIAFTGVVASDGMLLPVDRSGIKQKIEACLFSSVEILVVPKAQEEDCKKYVDELSVRFGEIPLLTIIGIQNIREILNDRRILVQYNKPFSHYSFQKIWQHRRPIAGILFLLMSLLIAKFLYGPFDKNPALIDFEGNLMSIKNRYGEIIKEVEVGAKVVNQSKISIDRCASVIDVNNDGFNEVIYFTRDESEKDYVFCFDLLNDSIMWKYSFDRTVDFPQNPVLDNRFFIRQIMAGDYDKNGYPEVYLLGSNSYYPALLVKLNAQQGKEEQAYLHIGHLLDMEFVDLINDGSDELILCGLNQAYKKACMIVLNPANMNGHGPFTGIYKPYGWKEAKEENYLLIPKTIVGENYPNSVWNIATGLDINRVEKLIKLNIEDAQGIISEYQIIFNYSLKPLYTNTHDNYDLLFENIVKQKNLNYPSRNEYLQNFIKTLVN